MKILWSDGGLFLEPENESERCGLLAIWNAQKVAPANAKEPSCSVNSDGVVFEKVANDFVGRK